MNKIQARGGCACGQVQYHLMQLPQEALYCHCRDCRRLTAAPVSVWVDVAAECFVLAKGVLDFWHSSAQVRRGYCQQCKTPMTYDYQYQGIRDFGVTLYSLEDSSKVVLSAHIWVSRQVIKIADNLPQYERETPDFTQRLAQAKREACS